MRRYYVLFLIRASISFCCSVISLFLVRSTRSISSFTTGPVWRVAEAVTVAFAPPVASPELEVEAPNNHEKMLLPLLIEMLLLPHPPRPSRHSLPR